MGNTVTVKPKEYVHTIDVTVNLIREFQDMIYMVDHSMSGLVTSIDAMRASCEMFLRHADNTYINVQETRGKYYIHTNLLEQSELAVDLLKTIDKSTCHQKLVAMKSLCNLLHLMIDAGKTYTDLSEDIELSLDTYVAHHKTDEKNETTYYDTRMEVLRKELKLMKESNALYIDEINILNEKEDSSIIERDKLRYLNTQLEHEIERIRTEIDTMANKTLEIEKSNEDLLKENNGMKRQVLVRDMEDKGRQEQSKQHETERIEELSDEVAIFKSEKNVTDEEMKHPRDEYEIPSVTKESLDVKLQARINTLAQKTTQESNRLIEGNTTIASDVELFSEEKNVTGGEVIMNEELIDKHLRDENQRLTAAKEKLEMELTKIKSKTFIQVQLHYSGHLSTSRNEYMSNLISKLEIVTKTESNQLYVIKQKHVSERNLDIPLLILCSTQQGISKAASDALKDIDGIRKVVLIFLHRDAKPSSITSSKFVIMKKEYRELGGIFDIVYDFSTGIYNCEFNDNNITGIADFVKDKGVKRSRAETYGLC